MKAITILASALALALSALPIAAQEGGVDNPNRNPVLEKLKDKRVVVIPMTMGVDLTIGWNELMQKQAREYGYTVDVRDANWSTEAGSRALTAAISEKPDLVVLQNPDVQSYARLIKQATAAGVKVLQLNMESLAPSDAYTGADWVGISYAAGKEVAARCAPGKGASTKAQIVMGGRLLDWIAIPRTVCRGGSGTVGVTEVSSSDEDWANGSNGAYSLAAGRVGKGGDGFLIVVVRSDQVNVEMDQ